MFVGEAMFGCALLTIPAYRRQFATMLRVNTLALLSINGANELINLGGGLGNRYALMFAPLSYGSGDRLDDDAIRLCFRRCIELVLAEIRP